LGETVKIVVADCVLEKTGVRHRTKKHIRKRKAATVMTARRKCERGDGGWWLDLRRKVVIRFEVRTGMTVVRTATTLGVSIESDCSDGVIWGVKWRKTMVASGGEGRPRREWESCRVDWRKLPSFNL